MSTVGLILLCAGAGFFSVQAILVAQFFFVLRRRPRKYVFKDSPSVAILLSIRGNDPSLVKCVKSIATQEYTNLTLVVVADDELDPGLATVKQTLSGFSQIDVRYFVNSEHLSTCGLKCSNLIHVIRQIQSEYKFFVLVDADTHPSSGWLGWMLSSFEDPKVAVTTGIRWFHPTGRMLGTMVRYVWNAAAIVQMVCYRIPWGGSLAIRSSFIKEADVLDHWSNGFCEDTMLQRLCRRHKKKVAVVPSAILPSREETGLSDCIPWISRQLLTTRLHHPKWLLVVGHGLMTLLMSLGLITTMIVLACLGNHQLLVESAVVFAGVQLGNYLLFFLIVYSVRLRQTREKSTIRRSGIGSQLFGIFVTQFCYAYAMLKTILLRKVSWRQIDYRIRGKSVQMVDYQPYRIESEDQEDGVNANTSL